MSSPRHSAHHAIGISAIEYVLPEPPATLEALAAEGLLTSGAERLRSFGFDRVYVSREPAETMASQAGSRLLTLNGVDPESIDALFYAGALPASHAVGNGDFLRGFNYPAARLQFELGLLRACSIGVSQVGCLGLTTAVKLARDFLCANAEARRVLCLSADVLPPHAPREIIYNAISDGACALLVERDTEHNRILAQCQVTKGYYWDCIERRNEIVAAYFPTAQYVVRQTLESAGLCAGDVAHILPHNVSLRSWEVLLGLLGFPRENLFAQNIAAKGHVIAADNWINLRDAADAGRLRSGDKLLLFNFGFGANWSCVLLEH